MLKGEDDSLLFLLCSNCHHKVEFDDNGFHRTDEEKRRVLRDREGALTEKRVAEQILEFKTQIKTLYRSRCHWCKGDTEMLRWNYDGDGDVYVINFASDHQMAIWACSSCRSVLDRNKAGQPRSDAEKLKLLSKKPVKNYRRRVPSTSFSITSSVKKLNAMQREGLLNEHHWNSANLRAQYESQPIEPERLAELERRYEETKMNGR